MPKVKPRRPVRGPRTDLVRLNHAKERQLLIELFDQVTAGSKPWRRGLATYVLIDLVLDMIAALDDPKMGAVLDGPAQQIEPDRHTPGYLQLYVEAWADRARRTKNGGWWELKTWAAGPAGEPLGLHDVVTNKVGEHRTYVVLQPDKKASERMRKLAWRIWQAGVRSGGEIGEREWLAWLEELTEPYREEFKDAV